jgi:hypothetical protein
LPQQGAFQVGPLQIRACELSPTQIRLAQVGLPMGGVMPLLEPLTV